MVLGLGGTNPELVTKMNSRLDQKGNAPVLKWIAPNLTKSKAFEGSVYVCQLNSDTEIGTPNYVKVEETILDRGGKILEKHSNRFEDTIIVDTANLNDSLGSIESLRSIDGIESVYPRPIPKAAGTKKKLKNGQEGDVVKVGGVCSQKQTRYQAAVLDSILKPFGDIKNRGKGVHIVIWDFLPEDREAFVTNPDMKDRPGGPPTVYDDETASENMHGGAVCSTCCGAGVGLAPESELSIIGLTSSITSDLSIIDEICKEFKGPVVVNMSFALEFQNVSQGDYDDVKKSMSLLTAAFDTLKERHKQLVFVVAAGNESLNACDTKQTVSFSGCNNCFMWPQSRLGTPYGWKDIPFIFVGATDAAQNSKDSGRKIASFSNFGKCVHVYTHGSPVCSLDTDKDGQYVAIAGTSFAAPLFASMIALYFSSNPGKSGYDATKYMIESSQKGTITFDAESSDSNNLFGIVPDEITTSSSSGTMSTGSGLTGWLPSGSKDKSSNIHNTMIILLVAIVVFFSFIALRKYRREQQMIRLAPRTF